MNNNIGIFCLYFCCFKCLLSQFTKIAEVCFLFEFIDVLGLMSLSNYKTLLYVDDYLFSCNYKSLGRCLDRPFSCLKQDVRYLVSTFLKVIRWMR